MNPEMNWYAVIINTGKEKYVLAALTEKKVEHYFPTIPSQNNFSKKENHKTPLFNSIIFVFVNELKLSVVARTKGVLGFLYWHNKLAVIDKEDITAIRNAVSSRNDIVVEKTNINRPYQQKSSKTISDINSVIIELPSLGYTLTLYPPPTVTSFNLKINQSSRQSVLTPN